MYRLTEEVVAVGPGDIDRHHAVDIGGIDLRVAHRRLAVHSFQCDLTDSAATDVDRGLVAASADAPDDAAAHGAAQQGAAQGQGRHLQSNAVFLHRLHLLHGLLRPAVMVLYRAGLGSRMRLRLAAVLPVGVVIEIVFVVIHNDCLLLCIPLIHCLEQRITWDRVKSMKFLIPIFELSRTALRKKPEAFQGLFLEPLTEV